MNIGVTFLSNLFFSVLDNLKGAFSKLRDQPNFQEFVEAKKTKGKSKPYFH